MQLESGRVSALTQVHTEDNPQRQFLVLVIIIIYLLSAYLWKFHSEPNTSPPGLEEICGYEWSMDLDRLFGEVVGKLSLLENCGQ